MDLKSDFLYSIYAITSTSRKRHTDITHNLLLAAFNIISVISRRQFTYSWSLGKQTSTRLENMPCPWALHHDRSAVTGDRTYKYVIFNAK